MTSIDYNALPDQYKSIEGILDLICDKYYIYDTDRCHFLAAWRGPLSCAISSDGGYSPTGAFLQSVTKEFDLSIPHPNTDGTIDLIIEDIKEIGFYTITDEKKFRDALLELCYHNSQRFRREFFKNKLSKRNNIIRF